MNRVRGLLMVATVIVASCSGGEPGGGGVNIVGPSSTTAATATTSLPPTTTSTVLLVQVSGRVTGEDGLPVARAFVTMGDQRSLTGPDGWFSFETNEPSTMTVAKPGWSSVEIAWDETTTFYEAVIAPQTIRGLRVWAEAAGDDARFGQLIDLANQTAVNALVFDTKQEEGKVLYDTAVEEARQMGAVDVWYDPRARIEEAHANGLYTITRIVTFEDAARAAAFPAEKLAGPWVDPTSDTVKRYNIDLAVEACEIGFDEIQFDYVRYPAGQTAEVSGQRDLTQEQRVAAIAGFLADARAALHPLGCAVSAAVFGIVTSTPDDQGMGQRPEEISAQVDTLSPMVYPSHYSSGWLGFDDPNQHPYDVTADAISDALPRMTPGSRLRPYLQAFWWTNDQIRQSIQAAEDLGTGWMMWNVLSNFDAAALPTDAEVGP